MAVRSGEGGSSSGSQSDEARCHLVCPPARGRYRGIELEYLDPAEPDERQILIEAEHKELHAALKRGDEEIFVAGTPMNPRLHITFHEIVANQLWDDDPPELWATAQRLLGLGYERHEVLHMLCSVVVHQVWGVMDSGRPTDPARYVAALDELPESYFALAARS